MIYEHPLNIVQQERSQRNFYWFNIVNGLSYMCQGETVLILLAVRLHCPDYIISTLGAMVYLGFVLLPLGKIVTAHIGAARSEALFWVYRNIAALVVASSTIFFVNGLSYLAMGLLITGAFFFYGCRAAGVIMSQPLLGDITNNQTQSKVVSLSWGLFNLSCLIALIIITFLLKISSSIWTLTGVITVGAGLGFFASNFIRKIDETAELRSSARKPIWQDFKSVCGKKEFRALLGAEFAVNTAVILVMPISMLTLKRGYMINDAEVLFFSLIQFGCSALVCFISPQLIERFGARRILILSFVELWLCAICWALAPLSRSWLHGMLIFFLLGAATVNTINCVACYFLQIVEPCHRVSTSIFRSLITNAGAGVVGMLFSGTLLKICSLWGKNLELYRWYFILTTFVLIVNLGLICKLPELPNSKSNL